jgi:hypothetical protein
MSKGKLALVQKTTGDPDLIGLFNQMVGVGEPDPTIVIPKYERILHNVTETTEILEHFTKSPCSRAFNKDFHSGFKDIENFVSAMKLLLEKLQLEPNDKIMTGEELNKINADPAKLAEFIMNMESQYKTANLGEKFRALKECVLVKEMIMMARNIKTALMIEKERAKVATHNLEDKNNLMDDFIVNCDGDFLKLFNFTSLDFKQMFCSDIMNKDLKKYTLFMINLVYVRSIDVVKDITSPDIDVDKFSKLLVANIGEIRKHIPRCDDAFDRIEQSVGLLKENFGDYYKSFVTSQNNNPGIIIESFVMDVANKNKANMQVTRQFRQIINFYQQQMQGKSIKDPTLKKMLSMVGDNLNILETKLEKKGGKKEDKTETPKEPTETPKAPTETPKESTEIPKAPAENSKVPPPDSSADSSKPISKNGKKKITRKTKDLEKFAKSDDLKKTST